MISPARPVQGSKEIIVEQLMTQAPVEESGTATATATVTDAPAAQVILPFERTSEEFYFESLGRLKLKPFYSFFKRFFDTLLSGVALLVLLLPMLIIAIAIKCNSRGPVLYRQERLGKNGRKFNIIKFRSMYIDAEKNGAQWSQGDDDARITSVGRFLRRTRLDELPQLWCIFIGRMSIVGPRPERPVFYDRFETYIHGFSERLKVTPGLTGLAQVSGGYDLRPEEKLVYDLEYIKKRSLWLDIKIIFRTVGVVFSHDGAK